MSSAQLSKRSYSWDWSIGHSVGALNDFIDVNSSRGFSFTYQSPLNDNQSIGIELGWNVFYQKLDYATYTDGTSSISGTQYRYLNSYPVLLSWQYHFSPEDDYDFFVGLGTGLVRLKQEVDMGLFAIQDDAWQFVIRPEAGLIWNYSDYSALKFGVRYYGAFSDNDLPSRSYITTNIGLVFTTF
jgi:hypothetical protein